MSISRARAKFKKFSVIIKSSIVNQGKLSNLDRLLRISVFYLLPNIMRIIEKCENGTVYAVDGSSENIHRQ